MTDWKTYAKAIVGGLATAIAFAIPIVDDGVVPSEWLGIAGAFIAGLGLVYITPNKQTGSASADSKSHSGTVRTINPADGEL